MEIFYTKEHEWVCVKGDTGTVGITEYAVEQLGDITFVDLPETGTSISQFDILCSIESVKAASDIYMPLSGEITGVNEELEVSPEIINSNPEGDGWLAKIKISNPDEKETLLVETEYLKYLEEFKQ